MINNEFKKLFEELEYLDEFSITQKYNKIIENSQKNINNSNLLNTNQNQINKKDFFIINKEKLIKSIILKQIKKIMNQENLITILNAISIELGINYSLQLDNILYKNDYKDRLNKIIDLIYLYKKDNLFVKTLIKDFNLFNIIENEIINRNENSLN